MNSPNPICHLHWVSVSFSHSQLTVYILTSILLSVFQTYLIFSFPVTYYFCPPVWKQSPLDTGLTSHFTSAQSTFPINILCFNLPLSHHSVSLVSQVRQCVPLTWSSWRQCLMGGSRSRNHPSLFGHPYQMKSSRNQGADGSNRFMHLCSGCYRRTMRTRHYYE